jgi:hypothetical protein
MNEPERMNVVYHAAGMGNYRQVVAEQMLLLREVGIADMLTRAGDSVRLSHVGEGLDWILAEAGRQDVPMTVIRSDPNVSHFETFAFIEMDRLAKCELSTLPFLYFHTKGVSAPGDQCKVGWRKAMESHVIRPWRRNLASLKTADAIGLNFWTRHANHFSGTFWIANADWLRKLPNFIEFHNAKERVRFTCELWIGSTPGIRAVSLGCQDEVGWHQNYEWARWTVPTPPPAITITWLCACTPKYLGDGKNLEATAKVLGAGHEFQLHLLEEPSRWWGCMKYDVLAQQLPRLTTTHAMWIDADSQFLCPLLTSDLFDAEHPLSALRHFCYGRPAGHLPPHLVSQVKRNADLYHQSCLFGGERSAFLELLAELKRFDQRDLNYDEHCLNILWDAMGPDRLRTLPCRYGKPIDFDPLPEAEPMYNARAGGPARILHINREIRR